MASAASIMRSASCTTSSRAFRCRKPHDTYALMASPIRKTDNSTTLNLSLKPIGPSSSAILRRRARRPGGRPARRCPRGADEASALLGAAVDLRDLLVALVECLGGFPVLDEDSLDHLRDDVRVQHLAGRRGRRARVAH